MRILKVTEAAWLFILGLEQVHKVSERFSAGLRAFYTSAYRACIYTRRRRGF